jgi:superfamily II DNA or RNA helicase
LIELRQYQKDGITKIFNAWDPKKDNLMKVLFQMPTGTGKTTVFSEIVRLAQKKNKNVLLVVHRTELVEQIKDRLASFEVEAGIITAGVKPNPNKAIQVATIQTLSRREYPKADIVIIDECHHSKAVTYKTLWDIYPNARFLGVTATPVRLNGEGFADLFDILIPLGKLSYFIKEGFLAPIKHRVCGIPNLENVKQVRRDYDLQMLKNVMLDNSLMADLIQSYIKYANGKKAIVFAVDIEHSKSIVERYLEAGINAVHIDANTPKQERKEKLEQFKKGIVKVLSNVDIVSEGFDVPDCEAVQLARPTKSLVLYLQQVGRCMRPAPGKEFGIVLDNAGLWLEHGISYIDRDWSLEGIKKHRKVVNPTDVVAIDEEGRIRELKRPPEADGLELIELTEELERLLIFESFLSQAINKEHKLVSVVYKYFTYLAEKNNSITEYEMKYAHKRLNKEGYTHKIGFWYHRKKELDELLKEK